MAKSGNKSMKNKPPVSAPEEKPTSEVKRFWSETVKAVREADENQATEEIQIHRKKAQINFSYNLRLIIVGILIFVLLNQIEAVAAAVGVVLDLLMPLLLGGMIALILNVPMRAFERLLGFLNRKLKLKKSNPQMRSVVSLVLTFVSVVLLESRETDITARINTIGITINKSTFLKFLFKSQAPFLFVGVNR